MAVTQYVYSVADDTLNGSVDVSALQTQVNENTSITIAVDHINSTGDVIDVYMSAELSGGEETELESTIAAHDGTPIIDPDIVELDSKYVDSDYVLKVQTQPVSGDSINYYSPNLCDPCGWYQNTTVITEFTMTDTGDHLTYNTDGTWPGPWVDITHGRIFLEDGILADDPTLKTKVEIRPNGGTWSEVVEHDWTEGTNNDYNVDYANGSVTFKDAQATDTDVRISVHQSPETYLWQLEPNPGKRLKLTYAEVQFTTDCVMNSSLVYETWAYNPYDLPNKFKVSELKYKTFGDIMWESTGPYPVIPPLGGGPPRGFVNSTVILPFKYQAFRDVRSSYGIEIRVTMDKTGPFDGEYASTTFYCLQEDE